MKIKIREPSIYLKNIYCHLIIPCIIFGTKDTWISWKDVRIMYAGLFMFFVITVPLMLIQKPQISLYQTRIVMILVLIICCSMIFNWDFSGYSLFLNLLIALLVVEYIAFETYFRLFEDVIFIFTLLSLAVVFIRCLYGVEYLQNFIITRTIPYTKVIPWEFRLYGIFREPAMYCIYLGLACVRQMFFIEKPSFVRMIIYLAAIGLTASATGYIAILFALFGYICINKKKWKFMLWLIATMSGGFILVVRYGVLDYFIERLSIYGASSHSSISRYLSIIGGAYIGVMNPFFGAGAIKSQLRFDDLMEAIGQEACWANMVTYLWASFGVAFIIIFLRGIYHMAYPREKMVSMIVLVFIMLLLCGETMTYSSVMWIFMLYGYSNREMGMVQCL